MAQFLAGGAFGRQNTLHHPSNCVGKKSMQTEQAYPECSFAISFGNSADFVGNDLVRQLSSIHHKNSHRATGVARATLAPDHFATLGVGRYASPNEIKSAYRNLAKRYHPDVCRGDQCQIKFIQVSTAYEHAINCKTGSNCPSNISRDDYFAEELEDWEEWMGWEGAGTLDYSTK